MKLPTLFYNFLFRKEKRILDDIVNSLPHKKESTPEMRAKLCPLCDEESSKTDVLEHEMFGMHKTDTMTWKPAPGHPKYPLHLKWTKLLGIPK